MAIHTLNLEVLPFQREPGNSMIKIGDISGTIMTAQTVIPNILNMPCHEIRIIPAMTILASSML